MTLKKNCAYKVTGSNYESLMRHIQKEGYRSHFKIIRTQYNDTKLHQEAIKECKYFNYYVKNL